jgi:ribonuclease P protein component
LGLVLPKKQARRSVTRSLLRHQAREAFRRHAPRVQAAGRHGAEVDGWVVRLRAPFDRKQFPSAASEALSAAVRQELDELWSRLGGPRA